MTEIETKLRELIAKICNDPTCIQGSERKRLLNCLLITVQKLPKLLKSSHIYYLEALDKTFEWLCRSICKFKPSLDDSRPYEEGLTRWINAYLRYRIKDLTTPKPEPINRSLDETIYQDDESLKTLLDILSTTSSEIPTIDGLDEYIERLQKEKNKNTFLEFEIYVEKDLERRLRNCHPREYPDCNCQMLCERILLQNPPEKMSVLSRELGINYKTLVAHWNRRCKPLLQEILLELGYCSS
ncbi:hypothetical protein ACL6C3_09320 [Capilliphycus salinus ALCB114379]|uniref:hypothetical protein n=1 Tax=Capilliphycus salinus TaxID=2768948 RepID=UPI0039A5D657